MYNKYLALITSKDINEKFAFFIYPTNTFSKVDSLDDINNHEAMIVGRNMFKGLFLNNPPHYYFEGKNISEVRTKIKDAFEIFKSDDFGLTKEEFEFLNSDRVLINIIKFSTSFHSI